MMRIAEYVLLIGLTAGSCMEITCDGLVCRAASSLAVGMTNKAELILRGRDRISSTTQCRLLVKQLGGQGQYSTKTTTKNEPEPNRDCFYPGSFRVYGRPR